MRPFIYRALQPNTVIIPINQLKLFVDAAFSRSLEKKNFYPKRSEALPDIVKERL
jgi:hypothetical protein